MANGEYSKIAKKIVFSLNVRSSFNVCFELEWIVAELQRKAETIPFLTGISDNPPFGGNPATRHCVVFKWRKPSCARKTTGKSTTVCMTCRLIQMGSLE